MRKTSAVLTLRRAVPAILGAAAIWVASLGGTAQAAPTPICISLAPIVNAKIVLFGPASACNTTARARTTRH